MKFKFTTLVITLFIALGVHAQITWNNLNGTNNWSDADNWDAVAVPSAGDNVIFDGAVSNDDCFIGDAGSEALNITFQNGYTGTVEVANGASITVYGTITLATNANLLVNGDFMTGILIANSGTILASGATTFTVSVDYGGTGATGGAFNISGCSFTAPSATPVIVTGNVSTLSTGSFNANGGTFQFSPRIAKSIGGGFSGSNSFNNFSFEHSGTGVISAAINAGGFRVNGTLSIVTSGTKTFLLNTGGIDLRGDLDISSNLASNATASNNSGGSSTITLGGSSLQTFIGNTSNSAGGNLPTVVIAQVGGGSIAFSDRVNFARNLVINNTSSITTNTSTVAFQNTTQTATLSGTTTTNVPFYNLTLNKSGSSFTISSLSASWVTISNLLTVTAGTFNTGNKLALTSTAANTSAQVASVGGTISGNVRVERFIPGSTGRKWRFLASSVSTSDFVSNNWQQQIHITGSGAGGTNCPSLTAHTNGFDATTSNSPSMYTYDETTGGFVSIASTNSTNLTRGVGYRVFIRGARGQGCSLLDGTNPTANNVILSATGSLATGTQTLNVTNGTGGGWNLLGNPFQAIIDWDNIARTNVGATYYTFNPSAGLGGVGAYGNYTSGGSGTNGATRYIGPGHSFWVLASAAGSISIEEADKAVTQTGSATTLFKTGASNDVSIKISDAAAYTDEVLVSFVTNATKCFDTDKDAEKYQFSLGVGNIATFNSCSPTKYAINSIPTYTSTSTDTIGIHIRVVANTSANYKLTFSGLTAIDHSLDIYLLDIYLNTYFNLRTNPVYNFTTIANNTATQGASRFRILIGTGLAALPVKLNNFEARPQGKTSKLTWTTAAELNSKAFIIERSTDATKYEAIGVIDAKGNSATKNTYQYNDLAPAMNENNYYRLKLVDKNGQYEYSNIQIVSFMDHTELNANIATAVFPIPATSYVTFTIGHEINSEIDYKLYDITGNLINEAVNLVPNANHELKVNLDYSLKSGFYVIELSDNFGNTQRIKFVKE